MRFDILDKKTIIKKTVEKMEFNKGGEVSSRLKNILSRLGISPANIRRAAIVCYELEINIIIHSEGGFIKADINNKQLSIIAEDTGPGIADVKKALQPGFSTAGHKIRELGFGAGMGLNNVKKYSDDLLIDTDSGKGTRVKAVIIF